MNPRISQEFMGRKELASFFGTNIGGTFSRIQSRPSLSLLCIPLPDLNRFASGSPVSALEQRDAPTSRCFGHDGEPWIDLPGVNCDLCRQSLKGGEERCLTTDDNELSCIRKCALISRVFATFTHTKQCDDMQCMFLASQLQIE